jgi:hypothetical protein
MSRSNSNMGDEDQADGYSGDALHSILLVILCSLQFGYEVLSLGFVIFYSVSSPGLV